jgi:hypothetical protein
LLFAGVVLIAAIVIASNCIEAHAAEDSSKVGIQLLDLSTSYRRWAVLNELSFYPVYFIFSALKGEKMNKT